MRVNIGPYPESDEPRLEEIEIHNYDVWSLDYTLALVILPALRLLKAQKQGVPTVDDSDLPENLQGPDADIESRWNWIMDEMIFAFEMALSDDYGTDQFNSGEIDFHTVEREDGLFELVAGENHTFEVDTVAEKAHMDRVQRGHMFFGKYYMSLWD